jgi:hypothetical protein
MFIYHQELWFDHRVLSVDCYVSIKLCVVHSNHVTETQKKNPQVVYLKCISPALTLNTKILAFGPCILFVHLLVFSEQTAIISLCSI